MSHDALSVPTTSAPPYPTEPRPTPERPVWPRGTTALRFGGDYNPEQWTRETWLEDIELMKRAGVNLVSVGIFNWGLIEPREGEYDFSQLDEIMDLLAGAGIDVDLGTPTASPPAWFWRSYPESRPVTRDGLPLAFGSRGMASPSSPDYRRAAVRVTEQLARRYASHPALAMWHVHNEYGAPVSESYDEHSVRAFRSWLQRRYGTLDGLNTTWGTAFWGQRYQSWDEIDAPRRAATVTNPTQRLDFARFTSDALLECFVAERDIIRRHTPELPVTTNFMATNCPSVDLWRWAREVDVVANDHYLVAERPDNHILLSMDADLTRSIAGGRPWMLMEHSTSAVNWQGRNIAKRPGELKRNSLAHLARGADAVMFFQFRASRSGAEKFHSAMLPHAGTETKVWRAVEELGADLAALSPLRGSTVTSRVAILWDWQSFWAQDLEWRPSVDMQHRERIEAFYTELWQLGVTTDFAHPESDISGYDLVVAPSLYLVSSAAGANLARYVEQGGTLLVSFGSGLVDENEAVHPGGFPGPLRDPLGLSIEELLPFRLGETATLDNGGTADVWADDIILGSAEPVIRFTDGRAEGQPALTRNSFGAGTAWYLSTRPDAGTLRRILEGSLAEAGVAVEAPPAGVETVVRSSEASSWRILLNHNASEVAVEAHGRNALSGERLDGEVTIAAGDVLIVETPKQRG
ncbi:beta-galactosidase [Leifsonia sp. SIMBA_070]|uniref:beta-galactosidase n=1 Tax=Leifsonia sp. SIMBA_070 TaxID=3085810 RepID=UPI003979AEF6